MTLAAQDRSRWHADEIGRGLSLVADLEPCAGYAEELRLQALIAAEHAGAQSASTTDWGAIATHYADLEEHTGSAIVRLNRAVAVAEVAGPRQGLALLDGLDDLLEGSHRLAAVRGELARRAGDLDLAAASYRVALARCANEVERAHLERQLTEIGHGPDPQRRSGAEP